MGGHGNSSFWRELGRRNVLRVGAAYAVASFAIIEVISNVAPALRLPDWTLALIIVLLALGFMGVVVFAWVYEITPDGLRRTEEVEHSVSITHRTAHRLNVVTIALMILLAGLYGTDRFLLTRGEAGGGARVAAEGGVSIAVLPFVNLSGDPTQEFFSDGMTEEITSALAKVKGLQVVGRTSAFEFKGQNKDLRAIGQALGATNILEGSVRKSGNRVRITGQLIRADNGRHIWTENYDRELTDVFATQDDIARSIAGALRVPLGLQAGESLVANRTVDTASYQDYLRAKAQVRARGGSTSFAASIALLEQVVARVPDYSPAWALLAQAYAQEPIFSTNPASAEEQRQIAEAAVLRAEAAGRRAIALDPLDANAYIGLAYIRATSGKYLEAEDLYKQAAKLDAFNPELLHLYGLTVAVVGRLNEAAAMRQRLKALEPFVPIYNAITVRIMFAAGQLEAALATTKAVPAEYLSRTISAERIYAAMGRNEEAAQTLLAMPAGAYSAGVVERAAHLLRLPPGHVQERDQPSLTGMEWVYFYAGEIPEALRFMTNTVHGMMRGIDAGYAPAAPFLTFYYRDFAPVRKTQDFKDLLSKSGLVEYWRARGWPDMCRPVGADDFECN